MEDKQLIVVSNWVKVEADDFYLSEAWKDGDCPERQAEAIELQAKGQLYEAFIVPAVNFVIYRQMDADKVFINREGDIILNCESAVIDTDYTYRREYGE